AQLGYGDGDENTVVGFGPNASDKYRTTYFRRKFTVESAASVSELTVRLMRDDGAMVYINGQLVFRSNMPATGVDYLTWASEVVGGGDESAYYENPVDPAVLMDGDNVVAVEVHQINATSSDLSFDLEILGQVDASNKPPSADAGADLVVSAPGTPVTLEGSATDDGLPESPGVFSASWSVISGPG